MYAGSQMNSADSYDHVPGALDAAGIGATTGSLRSWGHFSTQAPEASSSSSPPTTQSDRDRDRPWNSRSTGQDIHSGSSQSRSIHTGSSSSHRLNSAENDVRLSSRDSVSTLPVSASQSQVPSI